MLLDDMINQYVYPFEERGERPIVEPINNFWHFFYKE
jgi:hypothetical protein